MSEVRLESVLMRLGTDLPTLSKRVADLIYTRQESYRSIGDEALFVSVHRTAVMIFRALRRGHAHLDAEGLELVSETIRERYRVGVPTEETVREFALCAGQINQHFLRLCADLDVDGEEVLHGSDCLWRLRDAISERVVTFYDELNLQQAQLDTQQRAVLVRRLLTGMAAPSELKSLPVDAEADYAAVRCLTTDGSGLNLRQLESSGGLPMRRAFLALLDGECVGIVARPPQTTPGVVIGIGPMVPLSDIARSFDIADRIAHLAVYRRIDGVHTLADLAWQTAAVDQPEVNALLRRRFLEPLRRQGPFGADLEATVRSYLNHRCNYTDAARDLNLHVNTLRYRLRRFAEMTGADLDDPVDMVNVVWAFELGDLPPWTPHFQRLGLRSIRTTAPKGDLWPSRDMSALSLDPPMSLGLSGCRNGEMPLGSGKIELV